MTRGAGVAPRPSEKAPGHAAARLVYTGRVVPGSRLRATILLLALAGVQLLSVTAALAGDPSCRCDAEMCVHHPGQHPSAHHPPSHDAATHHVEPAASQHCAHGAATLAPRECSMRGCDQHRDELLPISPLASLAHPTTVARVDAVSALPRLTASPLLDRSTAIEPPPPRSFPV